MWADFISFLLIGLGAGLCLQGILALRGRLTLRASFWERPFIALWETKDKTRIPKILGRMRIIYGVFFITLGFWSLL